MRTFFYFLMLFGLFIYFITSSDSGSFCDDINAAGGMLDPPIGTKIYWAVTEGATATALLWVGGADALGALQSASIIAGFVWTVALCFMCTSVLRAVKLEMGDADITNGLKFSTSVFDIFDGFK